MSPTDSVSEDNRSDIEKGPGPLAEDVLSSTDGPVARTPTTPSAPLTELEKGLIAWDSPSDPQNPLHWPTWKRRLDMTLISIITFLSPLGSSIFAPGTALTMTDFDTTSNAIGALMITIFILGYAVGPMFLSPLSEIYGRYPVIVLSCWFFVALLIGCGFAPSMPALIIMRFLAGTGGSGVMSIAPAMVADIYPVEQRSFAMGIVLFVQSVSPAAGPICGGFIAQRLGWRWAYWILIIASGVVTILITFLMAESYAPAIVEKKTQRLRKELEREDLRSKLALEVTGLVLLKRSLVRPIKLLTRSPAVIAMSLYVATIYGMLYLLFTTIPTVFGDIYGWSIELTGLVYISFAIGMCLSLAILMKTTDKKVARLRKLNNGVFEPEMRLKGIVYFAACTGPAILVYGWTVQYRVHWIVPILALIPFGVGMVAIFLSCQTYIVDSFSVYAASAVAAVAFLRSILGAFLPFAGPPLLESLGVGWGNTVLGLIAICLTPIMPLFIRYGHQLRTKFPVQL
ncbi:MFS general substrate transporter [Tothia fuscella]|uniref:MFS general substrate transporter n=1 Tax=Tothia fuscella TaxID=1048955 RepID=A0A9P4NT92_9PEZI|nr:MFS general substrate transporter [Tothia fuscella]